MGKGNINVRPCKVNDGVKPRCCHVVVEKIFKTIAAQDASAVIEDSQARIEVGVVAEHVLHKLTVKSVALERVGSGSKNI